MVLFHSSKNKCIQLVSRTLKSQRQLSRPKRSNISYNNIQDIYYFQRTFIQMHSWQFSKLVFTLTQNMRSSFWFVWIFGFFSAISNLIDSGDRKVSKSYFYLLYIWDSLQNSAKLTFRKEEKRTNLIFRTKMQTICQIVGYLCLSLGAIVNIAFLTISLDR